MIRLKAPHCYSMISILLILTVNINTKKTQSYSRNYLRDTTTDVSVVRFMQNCNHTPGKLDLELYIFRL